MAATIGFVVAVLIWSARAGGDSSPSDTQLVPAVDQSAFAPTSFGEAAQSTMAGTTPKPGPVAGSAQDIPSTAAGGPQALVDISSDSLSVSPEQPTPRAAYARPADEPSTVSVTRGPLTSWGDSSPVAGQTARGGYSAAPAAGGGSSSGGAASSAGAPRGSTATNASAEQPLAGPLSASRQGVTDSALGSGPQASAARTDNHAPVFSTSGPLANLSGDAPVFSPSAPLANLSGNPWSSSSDVSSLASATSESTASGSTASILADAGPVSVPEPTSLVLFGAGLALLVRRLKRGERGAA